MRELVLSRAHRTLRKLPRYTSLFAESRSGPGYLKEVVLQDDEVMLGVYENTPEECEESIAVTDRGIHLFRKGSWDFVGYEQIARVEGPHNKQHGEGLVVYLLDGRMINVPVRGGDDRFKDAFEFLRFIKRVTEDIIIDR